MKNNFKQLLQKVRCFVFDVDGVLTDGSLIVSPGELLRTMNIRDGYALQLAARTGYKVIIISGGKSESVRERLTKLGIEEIYLGVDDKKTKLKEVMSNHQLQKEEILYMGDDLPDYEVMQSVGVPCCPADAAPQIKALSIYISTQAGGSGCARDVIEQVLRLHGKWPYVNTK